MGRPLGVKNGEGKNPLAPIAKWEPWMDLVVGLKLMQWSNGDIAKRVKKTSSRVSQILNDPIAKAAIRETAERIRAKMQEDVDDVLLDLCVPASERIRETIEAEDFLPGSDAKKHQDRLSMDLLKGVGFLPGATQSDGKVVEQISETVLKSYSDALKISAEADRIRDERLKENEIPVLEAEVVG